MPEKIINISKNVLKKLEKSHQSSSKIEVENDSDMQLSFFSLDDNNFKDFKKELESLDTDNLTPVEALVKLSELKKKITDND
jgi:DNA mismatch repair protein MutS